MVVWPHDLHIRVVLASKKVVAAVRSHHVFIHRELDLSPELTVLLRAHGQPEKNSYKHQKATEILSERKGKLKVAAVNKAVKAVALKKSFSLHSLLGNAW